MTISICPLEWLAEFMGIPLVVTQEQRYQLNPGTCVKKRGLTFTAQPAPGQYGILRKKTEQECVVVGHGWMDAPFEKYVWRGTLADFTREWEAD